MKSVNLELALGRFEISEDNDSISYIYKVFNGFSGGEGCDAYNLFLDKLYNDYFLNLRTQIDNLILQNIEVAFNFLKSKAILFDDIQNDFDTKSTLEFWIGNSKMLKNELEQKDTHSSLWNKIKNSKDTVDFYIEMINTQKFYINKSITEIQTIQNCYSPKSQNPIITDYGIDKEMWDNTLKDYPDVINTFDLAKIFNKDSRTINRWVKEGAIIPIDKNKRPQQFKKDDIKKYYLKVYQK